MKADEKVPYLTGHTSVNHILYEDFLQRYEYIHPANIYCQSDQNLHIDKI